MSQVLVDTSVWVERFRKGTTLEVQTLGELLSRGLVCTNGLIRAEILSGARSQTHYALLSDHFSAIPMLEDPPALWDIVARARYRLARKGIQASIADLIIAASAFHYQTTLFTLDASFTRIKDIIPFEILRVPRPSA